MSETRGRLLIAFACLLSLGGFLACPKPGPNPVTPTDADAAPAPSAQTCASACAVAAGACPTVDPATCQALCPMLPSAFLERLATARGCADVRAADPGAVQTAGKPAQHGR